MTQTISYSQYVLSGDPGFIGRISSILKDEAYAPAGESATEMAAAISQDVAAQPGIADAYHAAVIGDPPRGDAAVADDVITDAALLAAVAAVAAVP